MNTGLTLTAAGALLAGLVVATPAHADPPSYGSNGVFGVGDRPTNGWATASIPPGTYRVDQSPSMYPYLSPPGFWLRCSNFPCAGNYPGHIIASGNALRDQEHVRRHPAHRCRGLAGQRHLDDRGAGMSESRYLRVSSSHAPPIGTWYVTGDE